MRVILNNPRYTGRNVWNRQRRDEVLVDVEDVAAGHQTKLRWNDRSDWIWSAEPTHEPLVTSEDFAAVQAQMAAHAHRPTTERHRRTGGAIPSPGSCDAALCGRRMQGTGTTSTRPLPVPVSRPNTLWPTRSTTQRSAYVQGVGDHA